jgi:hypothetical protein
MKQEFRLYKATEKIKDSLKKPKEEVKPKTSKKAIMLFMLGLMIGSIAMVVATNTQDDFWNLFKGYEIIQSNLTACEYNLNLSRQASTYWYNEYQHKSVGSCPQCASCADSEVQCPICEDISKYSKCDLNKDCQVDYLDLGDWAGCQGMWNTGVYC